LVDKDDVVIGMRGWFGHGVVKRRHRRQARPQERAAFRLEQLESRTLLAFDPSAQAQEMLEHVNRMRMDPQAELQVLFTSLGPLTARDPDANAAIRYFKDQTGSSIQADWAAFRPVAPLAWNENLSTAAARHTALIISHDEQSHQLPGEPGLVDRFRNAGYAGYSAAGENVFAFSKSVFHAHSGFAIDWAVPDRGHRKMIMDPDFRDFGVGITAETSAATSVGPLVVTQNFGNRSGYGDAFVLGVAYRDGNGNRRYDAGEGLGGVTIDVSGPGGTFTTTTMSAGGYQLQVPGGTYTVTASGANLGEARQVSGVQVVSSNVKLDFQPVAAPAGSLPRPPMGVVAKAGNGMASLTWKRPTATTGGPVTSYVIQFSSDGGTNWTDFVQSGSANLRATVTDLTNRTSYVFRVAAVNAVGRGAFSAASKGVTPMAPVTRPTAPAIVAATAGDRRVDLSWSPPVFDGNAAITSYRIQYSTNGGRSWKTARTSASTGQSASVVQLSNGVSYVFRLAAVNSAGIGGYSSPSAPVTPVAATSG